jgi:putative SOS response-associated peptidase YedK
MTERWDDFMRYEIIPTPRASHRKPARLPRTLQDVRRRHLWLWVGCGRSGCRAVQSMPIAPLIIRFGTEADPERVAAVMRCSQCGYRGVRLNEPSGAGGDLKTIYEPRRWTGKQDWHPALGAFSVETMCNLYSQTRSREALRGLFRLSDNRCGEINAQPSIFPKSVAPVVRLAADGERELVAMMWGFPLIRKGYAPKPVTNVRDDTVLTSPFWRPSFESRRCLVPASSYCEPDDMSPAGWHWFALIPPEERPLFAFAGIWKRYAGPVKKDGPSIEIDVFAFMTTNPNALTSTIMHDRMPVLLSEPQEFDAWLNGSPDAAYGLVRPYDADRMRIVQSGSDKADRLGERQLSTLAGLKL